MPKSQQQIEWLNKYYDENNVNGDILEKSQAIADACNKTFETEGFVKGAKGRIIMKNGGLAAQTVGGHMADRKRMLDHQPRAIRNEEDEAKRLREVSNIRSRPYVGDKMLLMEANNITHQKVKNHFEERARQEANRAKKAGGQALIDFDASRSKMDTSNKYAARMWADYKTDKMGYLRKLRNGLISLKTGKAITGDTEEDFLYSALNPANGHIQSMSNGNRAGKGVAEVADEDSAESAEEGANFMVHREGYTLGSVGKVDSQMSFCDNEFGGDGSSDEYTSESPASYNDRLGTPQPKTNLSKDDTFEIQTRSHGSGFMPPLKQQSIRDLLPPQYSKSTHIGSQPSNQVDKSSNIGSVSLGESGWDYQEEKVSTGYRGRPARPHGSQADGFERGENSGPMALAVPSKKRKRALLEEEIMGGRRLKKQCQPTRQPKRRQPPQSLYNGLDLEGDVDERHVQELNLIEDFSIWNKEMMQENGVFHGQPHSHGAPNREGRCEDINNAAYAEGNLRNGSMANRENCPLDETRTGDSAENAISIPDDDEAEGARENQSIGNETKCNEKLSTTGEDEPGYLAGASSVKGYTNAWYYQGRLRI